MKMHEKNNKKEDEKKWKIEAAILIKFCKIPLAWAFAGRLCDKYHNLMSWLKC